VSEDSGRRSRRQPGGVLAQIGAALAGRRPADGQVAKIPVGVTIHAMRRQGYVIAVPFLVVCWLLIAWKVGVFTPRSG
jgi:hypothetical protein